VKTAEMPGEADAMYIHRREQLSNKIACRRQGDLNLTEVSTG